jgi:outer membrane protein assembly factor BamB
VHDEHVYALGGHGNLVCLKVSDGSEVWRASLIDLGGELQSWGYCESVLVDGDRVICTPGGNRGAVVALNRLTGKVLWRSTEFQDPAQYASPIVVEHSGQRQYIQLTQQSIVGLRAADGKLLWRSDFPGKVAVIPTPIYRDGQVYVSAGYSVGSKAVRLSNTHQVATVYENRVMKNHHGGVILVGQHLYGHSDGAGWICQDFRTGKEVWSEKSKLNKGAIACADGKLYLQSEEGEVVLIDASPVGWKEHGRFRLEPQTTKRSPQGRIWVHPVISHGRLYLRDQELLFSFDIREK